METIVERLDTREVKPDALIASAGTRDKQRSKKHYGNGQQVFVGGGHVLKDLFCPDSGSAGVIYGSAQPVRVTLNLTAPTTARDLFPYTKLRQTS